MRHRAKRPASGLSRLVDSLGLLDSSFVDSVSCLRDPFSSRARGSCRDDSVDDGRPPMQPTRALIRSLMVEARSGFLESGLAVKHPSRKLTRVHVERRIVATAFGAIAVRGGGVEPVPSDIDRLPTEPP